jgi:2-haloacid dehalogenase/putative hydrolase of the HAD superfamily
MSNRFAGIFLDFYGTLASGDRQAVEAICADIVSSHGLECCPSELAIQWGVNFLARIEQANDHAFCSLFECERLSLHQTLSSHGVCTDSTPYVLRLQAYLRKPPLFPDVVDALESFPLQICLVSNIDRADLEAALDEVGLEFDYVVTSEDAKSYKPHPGIFRHALQATGWPADKVLHVGDSLHSDIGGALGCGLHTAWLDRPGRISDVGTCESHYRIEVLNQLAQVIGGNG